MRKTSTCCPIVRKNEGASAYRRRDDIGDFRSMARRRLRPSSITSTARPTMRYRRNAEAYERCDLVPNILASIESIDMSITVMGQKIEMPLITSTR
jgi:L-lactate dehydrogenase (cytochrome)